MKSLHLIKLVLLFGMLGFSLSSSAQVNLVQNGSFEDYYTCPNNDGDLGFAKYWIQLLDTSGGSPDFMHTCANGSATVTSVPVNGLLSTFSYQQPHSGSGYGHIALFDLLTQVPNLSSRDYMTNKLSEPLKANTSYCVTLYLSLTNYSKAATNVIGAYFDDGSLTTVSSQALNLIPHMEYESPTMWVDTQKWIKVTGSFTATGGETYMTIGNFRNNANTDYIQMVSPGNGYWPSFYYIDDISVIEIENYSPAFAGNDTTLNVGDSLYLGTPSQLGYEYTWYNMAGDSIGTGSSMWVTPGHTEAYIVEQTVCGGITRDTVYVTVSTDAIAIGSVLEGVKVFPNPSQDIFHLTIPNTAGDAGDAIEIFICDLSGRKVYESILTGTDKKIETGLASGLYVLYLRDVRTGARAVKRVAIRN